MGEFIYLNMKRIILLGASGSIGSQTIDIIRDDDSFSLIAISCGKNIEQCQKILNEFPSIKFCYLIKKADVEYLKNKFPNVTFYCEEDGIDKLVENVDADMCVNALVGFVGLKPTLVALKKNMEVALANKEALVVGGELVNDLLSKGYGKIYPIDSEHAAIHQCLSVDSKNVKHLIITASGGAFRNLSRPQTKNLKKEDALKHPTWNMGAKITIDCATMMNKCFEIIEAHYLFNYPYRKIKVLLHDESMIHSMVKYNDGTYRGEVSKPDMHNPINYALHSGKYPFTTYLSDDYHKFGDFHFHRFNIKRYPLVKYASIVISKKGLSGTVLNASNEVAVNAFLQDKIGFLDIEYIVDQLMNSFVNIEHPSYEQIYETDQKTLQIANELIRKLRN